MVPTFLKFVVSEFVMTTYEHLNWNVVIMTTFVSPVVQKILISIIFVQ